LREGPCFRCIICSSENAFSPADENHRNRVSSRIATRVGIDMELAYELDLERGFLEGFSTSRLLDAFPDIDESAWQSPAQWWILAPNENEISFFTDLDDHIDGQFRLTILFHDENSSPTSSIAWVWVFS
jgi:hypothetical protein